MNEETFQLTFYGWLAARLGSQVEVKPLLENLYEWMQKQECNAIIFDDFSGSFEKVQFVKEWDEDNNEEEDLDKE